MSGSGEKVRWTTGYGDRCTQIIQLEQFRICPGIGTVKSHINRNISHNGNALLIGIFLQRFPLFCKIVLLEYVIPDIIFILLPVLCQRFWFAQFDVFRPFVPGFALKPILQSHKQGIVFHPKSIILKEQLHIRRRICFTSFICFPQQNKPCIKYFVIIHITGMAAPNRCLTLFFGQVPILYQFFQINKIGISRKGGKRLIGRVSISGRAKGQNLPIALTGFFQKIHKFVCFL